MIFLNHLKTTNALILLSTLLLIACSGGSDNSGIPDPNQDTGSGTIPPFEEGVSSNFPGELSKVEYDSLSNQQKYLVANKLLGTMYKGIPVDEFFDISNGIDTLSLKAGATFLEDTKAALEYTMPYEETIKNDLLISDNDDQNQSSINPRYRSLFSINFNSAVSNYPKQFPMARIYQYPLSKQSFNLWVTYILTNSILFSPAEEINSTSIRDVQKVFDKLYNDLSSNRPINQVIARHQYSQENWRRFSSPEENTRAMLEVYLGLTGRDDDVSRASIACKNLFLSNEANSYELLSTGIINSEPQFVIDTFVTTCGDFYNFISNHSLLIPRVTAIIVDQLFYKKSEIEKTAIVQNTLENNPVTFQDIFKSIILSKEYLLNNERPKYIEEAFFSTAHQLDWKPDRDVLENITEVNSNTKMNFDQMGTPIMSLKMGRSAGVPLNGYSFANYHKGLREDLMLGTAVQSTVVGNRTCNSNVENMEGRNSCRWKMGLGIEIPDTLPAAPTGMVSDSVLAKYEYEQNRLVELTSRFNRVKELSMQDYIDYIFLTAIQRKASSVEATDLITYFDERGFLDLNIQNQQFIKTTANDEVAQVIFDYVSRLPEFYYFLKIN